MDKPPAPIADRIAHLITHRPRLLWLAAVTLLAAAAALIAGRARLNSDVLDMLPGHFESVRIYKTADREFSSARELMFGLVAHSDETDLDAFTAHFADALRKEPWAVRVMERSPLEAPGGLEELRSVALPLMLNQRGEDFDRLIAALQPEAITERLSKLRSKIESGVGLSQVQLEYDPLGIVFPALKSLGAHPEMATDPHFRLVFVHCDQADLNEPACNDIMRKVRDFKERVVRDWKDGPAPEILCTGRTAYVSEMAGILKSDIFSTLLSSLVLVTLTFFAAFRKWRPLRAIMEALMFSCVLAVACGAALFAQLNMITIGLGAILVGLGVDFAMVLFSLYLHEREAGLDVERSIAAALRSRGKAIWFGALTTAAAFLCLLGSGSLGYQQLGALIACGILIAAATMMSFFWLFLGARLPRWLHKAVLVLLACAAVAGLYFIATTIHSWSANAWENIGSGLGLAVFTAVLVHFLCKWIVRLPRIALSAPWRLLGPATLVLVALSVAALAPVGRVIFDINPKTLEPKHSEAGRALRAIMDRLNPGKVDTVIALVQSQDTESLAATWEKVQAAWKQLTPDGAAGARAPVPLSTVSTPAGLATSPARMTGNAARLAEFDFGKVTAAFDATLKANDFAPEQFAAARGLLGALGEAASGKLSVVEWRRNLPETSAWWFVIDGFLSREHSMGMARLMPNRDIKTSAEAEKLRSELAVPGVKIGLAGWAYTLAELGPWSQRKMIELSALMVVLNIVMLTIFLRAFKSVLILMLGLALSIGALIATLKVTGIALNLFNILAFPLVLGVGVDYGIYIALALRSADPPRELHALMKPVLLSGLTTVVGFGSLAWAQNPALRGLGLLCGIGVGWCLAATFLFILPACALAVRKKG